MTDDEIQLDGFTTWFFSMLHACESALMRDVLREQKKNLREEWMRIRPMHDSKTSARCEGTPLKRRENEKRIRNTKG
jgi:hypothetical protein